MAITALYAGLLVPLFIYLTIRVIGARRGEKIAIGHGESHFLLRRMRVHANFSEYVPLTLICMGLAESLHTHHILLHGMGIFLIIGRCLHAYGVSQEKEVFKFRVIGMVCTLTVLSIAALACLYGAIMAA
jgi:uncharacterized membrane protein YecN with MAPEG domain